jgi:hypothetical protein
MLNNITEIFETIEKFDSQENNLQPTLLYNEGWMLRLVLKWFSDHKGIDHHLSMKENTRWFSEGLIKSKFAATFRGDNLAEGYTHADGLYGDFVIGGNGFGDVALKDNCRQFAVVEAKMFSKLSPGITHSPNYNQFARNVACICNLVTESKQNVEDIGFFVIIPKLQITNEGTFYQYFDNENVMDVVLERVNQYKGREDFEEKKNWYNNSFMPFLKKLNTEILTWEEIIEFINSHDPKYGSELNKFYEKCVHYNRYSKTYSIYLIK